MKKVPTILLFCLLVILTVGCSSTKNANAQAEAKKQAELDKAKYNEALASFYKDTDLTFSYSEEILTKYLEYWDLLGADSVDAAMAVSRETRDKANELFEGLPDNLKLVSEAAKQYPEEYQEIYDETKNLYETTIALMEQVNSPSGNYITFTENTTTLSQDYKSNRVLIDALLSDDVKELIE
ncbi:hypothetical protein [Bacillus sp. AFS040349]|uniref:hypothetical protein n=1 Tax=Bacillus sp. AFS040349 TaxID=2033502 RepID=UPI000BFB9BDB|nr:hypothetical protein [Bacillus sp. AFS040349]PGT83254.1 hypothetical protein COD11_13035 [Bacillus sp. AFS040349]